MAFGTRAKHRAYNTAREYIAKELQQSRWQPVEFQGVTQVKSGLKGGEKISDKDARWVEKWFEVRCTDLPLDKNAKPQEIIVK